MRIAIYADDPPIREDIVAAGLNRINTRYFTAINDDISIIAASYEKSNYTVKELAPNLQKKIISLHLSTSVINILKKIDKLLERVAGKNFGLLSQICRPTIIKAIKQSNSDIIFVPLGADIRGYIRAVELARTANLPLAVFIGDDFENYARLSNGKNNKKLVEKHLQRCLNATNKFFVISKGLQTLMVENYQVSSTVLNLPFKKQYSVDTAIRNNTVFFLGNASHFYHDGLIDMMDVICDYNEQYNSNVLMQFSIVNLPAIFTKRHLQYIHYGQYENDYSQSEAIAKSLFCIIPTSFEKKYQGIISTSFPSKLMECMAFAKKIVVYGPKDSSSVAYFAENGLQDYIDERDKKKLFSTLQREMDHPSDHSESYNKALIQNHSYDAIKNTILHGLKLSKITV